MLEDRSTTVSGLLHRRRVACGILTAVAFLSAVVLARRVSGDIAPLSGTAGALMGVLAVGISGLCAIVPGVLRGPAVAGDRLLVIGLVSMPGLILGLSLLPAGSAAGFCAVVGAYAVSVFSGVMAGDAVFRSRVDGTAQRVQRNPDGTGETEGPGPQAAANADGQTAPGQKLIPDSSTVSTSVAEVAGRWTETVLHPSENTETTQWMSRTATSAGESAEGGCRIEFAVQQKVMAVHIPFSPAFSVVPCFECEAIDGTGVKIKVSARYRYGVRLELTRQGDLSLTRSVPLEWYAAAKADFAAERSAA